MPDSPLLLPQSERPRLLDLFCKQGGAGTGFSRAGFDVIGVDKEPQPRYPFEFIQMDALEALECLLERGLNAPQGFEGFGYFQLCDFAAVHSSPPCQAHSDLAHHPQNRHIEYPDLIAPTRALLKATGLPYVIENVEGAPLIDPVTMCGSSFGLPLKRHRLFETNFPLMVPPCAHGQLAKRFKIWRHGEIIDTAFVPVYGTGGGKAAEHWAGAMGIDWMDRDGLSQAIPPAYTEHIGHYLMAELTRLEAAA